MVSILLVSHGPLAKALAESAEMVAGKREHLYALGLAAGETAEHFGARVRARLDACLKRGEVILLSDLVLGTPFNVAAELMEERSFRHLTAMNLPLLVALLSAREETGGLPELCRRALEGAAAQMMDVNDFIGGLAR